MPLTSPPLMVNTGPSAGPCSARARISPSSMMNMNSGLSPSRITMSPAARRSSWHLETNQSRSSCGRSEKTAILRNCSTSCSGGVVNSSVMRDKLFWRPASLDFGQILVHELNDDSAFADARGDALDRAVAHVTHDKNSGNARFKQAGIAAERPGRRPLAIVNQVGAGQDEAAIVALDGIAEPFGARQRANRDEEAVIRELIVFAGIRAMNGDACMAGGIMHSGEASLRPDIVVVPIVYLP